MIIAIDLQGELSALEKATESLSQRPRIVPVSPTPEGIGEIMAARTSDLRLIVLGFGGRPESALSLLPQLRRAGDNVRVPVVALGSASPEVVSQLENTGANSVLELPPGDGVSEYLATALRYWMTLNLVPLKNR